MKSQCPQAAAAGGMPAARRYPPAAPATRPAPRFPSGARFARRAAAGAGIAIPIGSTAANALIFGRKPIAIPRKFRIRFRNRTTPVFGRLVVLRQYGRSLAGMVRARAIRRGHRLARQRSGALTGRAPAAPESQVLVNAISGVLLCLAIVDRLIVALATFMRLNAVGSYRGCV